jgi:hypothetical protein
MIWEMDQFIFEMHGFMFQVIQFMAEIIEMGYGGGLNDLGDGSIHI